MLHQSVLVAPDLALGRVRGPLRLDLLGPYEPRGKAHEVLALRQVVVPLAHINEADGPRAVDQERRGACYADAVEREGPIDAIVAGNAASLVRENREPRAPRTEGAAQTGQVLRDDHEHVDARRADPPPLLVELG